MARYPTRSRVTGLPSGASSSWSYRAMDVARQWIASPEYAKALEARQGALRRRLLFVDGVVDGPGERL
ncbi:DUF1330 domain-containing protein [Planosporangium thailandense]|uniref:DUF1330 domain-containing protein n=1 Tax=Planosporangium thailandense TaxID=765197 RepID=UPI0030B7F936